MIVQTSYWQNLLASILAEKIGSGGFSGPLYGLTIHLVQNQLLLTPQTTWAQLTEANYSGYAAQASLAWGNPILQGDGTYTILSGLTTWTASAASNFIGNTVWGWAITDAAGANLMLAEMFQSPVPFVNPGDGFGLVVEFNVLPLNPNSFGTVLA
jgi:hypothetical protein